MLYLLIGGWIHHPFPFSLFPLLVSTVGFIWSIPWYYGVLNRCPYNPPFFASRPHILCSFLPAGSRGTYIYALFWYQIAACSVYFNFIICWVRRTWFPPFPLVSNHPTLTYLWFCFRDLRSVSHRWNWHPPGWCSRGVCRTEIPAVSPSLRTHSNKTKE